MSGTSRTSVNAKDGRGAMCSRCHRRKGKIHRSRKTGQLVCAACSDRARMRNDVCSDCGERKLIQARGLCYACYKRLWRAIRAPRLVKPLDQPAPLG